MTPSPSSPLPWKVREPKQWGDEAYMVDASGIPVDIEVEYDYIVLCANSFHKMREALEHIANAEFGAREAAKKVLAALKASEGI